LSLRHYADILWRRKWTVVLTTAIVTLIVLAASLLQASTYTAIARILVESPSSTINVATGATLDSTVPDDRETQTLASFVTTPEVGQRALTGLGWKGAARDYADKVRAEADIAANIISVVADQPTADKASALANAYAEEFVAWRRESQLATVREALDLVNRELADATPGSNNQQLLKERQHQLEAIMALTTGGVQVGEAALPPLAPSSPRPKRNTALALAAGLLLGVGLAFLREALDNNLHSAEEIGERIDIPVIAEIPEFRKSESNADKLVALANPTGPTAEAYRFLRTNLDFVNFNRDHNVLMITSPLPGQGKSTTIANLAVALVRSGSKVAVVEGDLRRPSLHRFFKIGNTRGVSSVVSGASPLSDAVQRLTFHADGPMVTTSGGSAGAADPARPSSGGALTLAVLPSGPIPPNPGEIVASRQLADILGSMKEGADYVLVDAPPMFAVGDAAAMAATVDGIIVILRLQQTTYDTLRSVEEFFSRLPAKALGVVITGVPRGGRSGRYRYGDYSG